MKIYLAARYTRREELCGYRSQLEAEGHQVTSRWLNGNHQIDDNGLSAEAAEGERVSFAVEDWQDLLAADACISFTEVPRSERTRGGRHVEFGAALALHKLCIVIGHRENVFHCLPQVVFMPQWNFLSVFDALSCRDVLAPRSPRTQPSQSRPTPGQVAYEAYASRFPGGKATSSAIPSP